LNRLNRCPECWNIDTGGNLIQEVLVNSAAEIIPVKVRHFLSRFTGYLWAAPNTAFGVVAGLITVILGGRLCFVSGVAEVHGGLVPRFFTGVAGLHGIGALTLGHVILGVSQTELSALRDHEHVHIRQYERWGLFFLPAYALSSIWQFASGHHVYRDNFFERQANIFEANQGFRLNSLC